MSAERASKVEFGYQASCFAPVCVLGTLGGDWRSVLDPQGGRRRKRGILLLLRGLSRRRMESGGVERASERRPRSLTANAFLTVE